MRWSASILQIVKNSKCTRGRRINTIRKFNRQTDTSPCPPSPISQPQPEQPSITVHPACLKQTAKTRNFSLSPPKTKYQEATNLLFAPTLQPSNRHITTSCTPPYHSSPTTQIKHTTFFFNSNGRSASSTAPSASGARSPAGTTGLHAQRKRRSFGRYPQRCQLEESYNCR